MKTVSPTYRPIRKLKAEAGDAFTYRYSQDGIMFGVFYHGLGPSETGSIEDLCELVSRLFGADVASYVFSGCSLSEEIVFQMEAFGVAIPWRRLIDLNFAPDLGNMVRTGRVVPYLKNPDAVPGYRIVS